MLKGHVLVEAVRPQYHGKAYDEELGTYIGDIEEIQAHSDTLTISRTTP